MIRLKSLKQKLALLVILPLSLIMLVAGSIGMRLITNVLLEQWEETAMSKMQRSAHNVDMRLMRPKEVFRFFEQNEENQIFLKDAQLVIAQLKAIEGVIEVHADLPMLNQHIMGRMFTLNKTTISSLGYDTKVKGQTVSVVAQFVDNAGTNTAHIEVVVEFFDLVKQIVQAPWWKGNKAFIIDQNGSILASTERGETKSENTSEKQRIFGATDKMEATTWDAIQQNKSGTVFSPGMPPAMVSGFYRLQEAPWTIVVMAPGASVLQPILTFKSYYYVLCSVVILGVLLYLWIITSRVTRSINGLSTAANDLAKGIFGSPLSIETHDEIGDLTHSFNTMSKQLEERIQLRQEMSLAGEVQNNLLPQTGFKAEGLDIAVLTKFCDETGGDYVDIIKKSQSKRRATVVVGDVVGHGIGASLLMATLRALVRGRAATPGSAKDITSDVNRLLCKDTLQSGNFATLFYITIDCAQKSMEWVRCGHEPGLVFSPTKDTFTELKGAGIAMGIDNESQTTLNKSRFIDNNQIILIGTDGIWDVENSVGERFGKERTKELIVKHSHLSSQEITNNILEAIEIFRGKSPQNDDITLAVIKTDTQ